MADRLTTKINRLKRDMRSMRRWAALERWLGVLVVVLALAVAFWFWQNRGGAIVQSVAPPISAAPAPAGTTSPVPAPMTRGQAEPDAVAAPTRSASDDAAQRVARFGNVEITVERATITNMILTEFFGISAVDPDAALVIVVRVANLGLTDRVRYTTMRIGSSVVDDVGRRYTGREYGAIPAGGMAAAVIEPGGVITDVLIFDAPATDASYVDLIVPGRCVGAASTRAIRVPAELLEIALEVRPDPAEALPRRPAPQSPVAPPAPPGPPPGELVAGYRLAAEQGDPEGLWNLGRAYRDGFGVPRDPRKALKHFRAAGQKDHPQAMWDAVQMLVEGDGIASDTHQAGQWLQRLMKLGERQAHFELADLNPMQYCNAARILRPLRAGASNVPGSAVKAAGRLREPDGDTWTMVLENRRTVDVDMSEIADPHVAEGIYVEVCGILNRDLAIEALVGEVPEPVYYLERPVVDVPTGGVIAHRTTQYVMRGVVRNTGRQPIRAITLTVRVRVGSSVSPIQVVTVYDLSPGASTEYSAAFTMRNPNVTSRPVAEITEHTYDW